MNREKLLAKLERKGIKRTAAENINTAEQVERLSKYLELNPGEDAIRNYILFLNESVEVPRRGNEK